MKNRNDEIVAKVVMLEATQLGESTHGQGNDGDDFYESQRQAAAMAAKVVKMPTQLPF